MRRIQISAESRSGTGKGPNRRLRASGFVPAVLYGQGGEVLSLSLNEHDFLKATAKLGDELVMFEMTAPSAGIESQLSMVREAQRDPVTERLVHLDFIRIDMNTPIDVFVAVHEQGLALGVREGGHVEHVMRTVHLRCLPDIVPSHLEMDITELAIGDSLHVSDIDLGEDIEMLSPATDVLLHIVAARLEEEPTEVEGEVEGEGEGEEEAAAAEETPEA